MKGTRNSTNKRNIVTVPEAGMNQESDSNCDKTLPQVSQYNTRLKKPQKTNVASNGDNLSSKIIDNNMQFTTNCINTEQISNLPAKKKLNFKNLKRELIIAGSDKHEMNKNKSKATVNLEMMKEELKQLEDPPITQWEKNLMAARLPYSFFDSPCEQLAQDLLGKILVRKLENGVILKGRIVETESYLGTVDKASFTYQYKVSARNLPMYMPPGTIFVYLTYGMYHCFNLSCQESESRVQIRSVEPLIGLDYMELLLNTREIEGQKEKEMVENIQHYEAQDLCNDPSKICTAFNIEKDNFNQKHISQNFELWIEKDLKLKSLTIVTVLNTETDENKLPARRCRYISKNLEYQPQSE